MINVIKKEIDMEESLKKRLEIICDFCNTTTIINGIIRKTDKTNLDDKVKDDFVKVYELKKNQLLQAIQLF